MSGADEPRFANVGLSRDARAVLDAHFKAQFGRGPIAGLEQCVRGEATPWIRAGKMSSRSHAYRQAAPTAAMETVVLEDGANITIINSGCEYYTASIRYVFPLSRPASKGELLVHVSDALSRLRGLGARSIFDFKKCEAELSRHKDLVDLLRSGNELPIPDDGIDFLQTRIVLTRAATVRDGAGVVEFRLFKGPL